MMNQASNKSTFSCSANRTIVDDRSNGYTLLILSNHMRGKLYMMLHPSLQNFVSVILLSRVARDLSCIPKNLYQIRAGSKHIPCLLFCFQLMDHILIVFEGKKPV
jgi:hypothetical protein